MNILVLGNGGREHALAWKLTQSPHCDALWVAPGNAGWPKTAALDPLDFPSIAAFVRQNHIGMLVVGPEAPLVAGIVDYFQDLADLDFCKVIGPSAAAAKLEGSKVFAKHFMARHGIPTAPFQAFDRNNLYQGFKAIDAASPPYVLKADGLAAGKGVLILNNPDEAKRELATMTNPDKFGDAGRVVLLETFLPGKECSVFALCDGQDFLLLPSAKDYKRIGENDQGLNTGGMGAISPWPEETPDFLQEVSQRIIAPVLRGMAQEGNPFHGFLYVGLMVSDLGEPFVIEFNARMGDPETQAVLLRIQNDLLPLLSATSQPGALKTCRIDLRPEAAAVIVLAAPGYPGNYPKRLVVQTAPDIDKLSGHLFHAGTLREGSRLLSSGGRVFGAAALGDSRREALIKAYQLAKAVRFEGMQFRSDIGYEWP